MQIGQVLRLKNRPRNVRDSKSAEAFVRELLTELRVVVYRKRVHQQSAKNYQLDLFSSDDGYFEYSAVATNLTLTPRALWYFAAGRGAQEKTIAELKGEYALDAVRTNHYGANSAWLQLCVLAHNLMRSFQLHVNLVTPKPPSRKRTYSYRIASMKTLRFLLINHTTRLARVSGRKVRRFSANSATESLYAPILTRLVA